MFEKRLEEIFDESYADVLDGSYAPKPAKLYRLQESDREVSELNERDKEIQTILLHELNDYFDKKFSDKSYAFRKNKSVYKAINRAKDYIQKHFFIVYKTDIQDFFESIDHQILIKKLKKEIADERIVELLALFIKNSAIEGLEYRHKVRGINQGDILSPLLSNIYLHELDAFLEDHEIEFIRYADDLVLFFRDLRKAQEQVKLFVSKLKELKLSTNDTKSYYANVMFDGFSFLGAFFKGDRVAVDNEHLQEMISSFSQLRHLPLSEYLQKFKEKYLGIQNHLLKLISKKDPQYLHFYNSLQQILAARVKNELLHSSKKEILRFVPKDDPIYPLLKGSLAKISTVDQKIEQQKNITIKELAADSVIYIDGYGKSLSISKNSLVIRELGKTKNKIALSYISKILINTQNVSLTTKLIYKALQKGITIEFIDKDLQPFGTILPFNGTMYRLYMVQLQFLQDTTKRLMLAKAFTKAKAKNQINLIRYKNKYFVQMQSLIKQMKERAKMIDGAKSVDALLGIEGSISALYWDAIGNIINEPYFKREPGAKDLLNSTFNYGYAILYNAVQKAVIKAGLSPYISYLHSLQDNKPTLVFDMIEEFRSYVVDRSIVALYNRGTKLEIKPYEGLSAASRKAIAQAILQRLHAYVPYHGKDRKILHIIQEQAYRLRATFLEGKRYRGFVGRY